MTRVNEEKLRKEICAGSLCQDRWTFIKQNKILNYGKPNVAIFN